MRAEIGTEEIVVPDTVEELFGNTDTRLDVPWVVIVWDDPINLMDYVTYVFQKLFGYPKAKARKLMLQVHNEGQGRRRRTAPGSVARTTSRGCTRTGSGPRCSTTTEVGPPPTVDRRDGSVVLTLHDREIQVLQWVFSDLGRMLERRLECRRRDAATVPARVSRSHRGGRPRTQWQALVHDDLVELRLDRHDRGGAQPRRRGAGRAGCRGVREMVLGEELAAHWIGVLNDARLAVGTALGVTAEWDFDALDPEDAELRVARAVRLDDRAARRACWAATTG